MKKTILLLVLAILTSSLFAGPFGLEMGMTLEEIKEKCGGKEPKYIGGGVSYNIEPIKKNDMFIKYNVSVHDNLGLFTIIAKTAPFDAEECKAKLKLLALMLGAHYGKEEANTDGNAYLWLPSYHEVLKKEKLSAVMLRIVPTDEEKEYIGLMYVFENFQKAQETSGGPF